MGFEGVVGDFAGEVVAEFFVEGRGAAIDRGVEHEEGAGVIPREALGFAHEGGGDALAAMGGADDEFGDFGAVRLVGGRVEQEGYGADEGVGFVGAEEDAGAGGGSGEGLGPEGGGRFGGEWVHEADGGAEGDGFGEEGGEGGNGGSGVGEGGDHEVWHEAWHEVRAAWFNDGRVHRQ